MRRQMGENKLDISRLNFFVFPAVRPPEILSIGRHHCRGAGCGGYAHPDPTPVGAPVQATVRTAPQVQARGH